MLHPQVGGGDVQVIATGLAASPGAGVGRAYFTADGAAEAAGRGEAVILVRQETSPEDVHGMIVSKGILTSRGGLVSHAAVVARGWGTPAVVGADGVKIRGNSFDAGGVTVNEGDMISVDGSTGRVMLGAVEVTVSEPPPEFQTILGWADEIRAGKMAVRANADTGADASNARRFGAEGIGLSRTEHMFFDADRITAVREMIMADNEEEEAAALEELRVAQKADFYEVLEAMDGLPVTIRLLDPPLHEFLPDVEELLVREARGNLEPEDRRLLNAAQLWREANPMLGTRGCRLGIIKPGLYRMQAKAIIEAALARKRAGGDPHVEIMIPLIVTEPELELLEGWVREVADQLIADSDVSIDYLVGT
ncbi:MAG TPA: putative PEP-binding protein, partial [Gemmatimonadales bacterium]|nr:putative PEP-binding protein [Gemmatimonadales bacterium]